MEREREREREREDEGDEDDDKADLLLYGCRLKWWPLGDETDDDLDTSSEPEVFYLDSEDEDVDSSGNESGYFTPPNSPAEGLLVEDFMTEDEEEPIMSEEDMTPPLLSDSEPSDSEDDEDSEDDDIDTPIHQYLYNKPNLSVARGREDQNPPGARVWTDDTPHDDTKEEYQEVTAEILLHILKMNEERNAVTETATASESLPVAEPSPTLRHEQVISMA